MINDLKALAIFAETARLGSFRKAAKKLSLSPSVVSYHILQLEQKLKTPLMYRSTRKLSLTSQGEILYQHASEMVERANEGMNKLFSYDGTLSGNLTVTIPSALTRSPINRKIAEFSKRYPGVSLRLIYTDLRQDLIEKSIDIAIRTGDLEDSSLKSKRIGKIKRKLVCSNDYLSSRKMPQHPRDLKGWRWIWFEIMPKYRELTSDSGEEYLLKYDSSNISVDSVEAMTELCCLGLGLTTPPDFLVQDSLERGVLMELLPNWNLKRVPVSALWHANSQADYKVRAFLDFIQRDSFASKREKNV